ncbi:MAG: YbaB/EbfC family nucleoid-associated protein [Fusobacteriaceae bacterium]
MVRKLKSGYGASNGGAVADTDLLKKAQLMQDEMLKIQEQLKSKELEASVGGGAVVAKVDGQKNLIGIKISEEIIKEASEDKEMLEDLVLSAIKEAMRQADELSEKEMSKITGGVSIPGLF